MPDPTCRAMSVATPAVARALAAAAVALSLSACGALNNVSRGIVSVISPYRIDIVQGNFVSSEQVAALKPGMPRTQVRDILGTPLLTDVFHANRWDYVFTLKRAGAAVVERRLTLFFSGDALERFEGDEMPSEAEFVATLDSGRRPARVPLLEAAPAQLEKFAPPAQKSAAKKDEQRSGQQRVNENAVLPSSYPPLEASSFSSSLR